MPARAGACGARHRSLRRMEEMESSRTGMNDSSRRTASGGMNDSSHSTLPDVSESSLGGVASPSHNRRSIGRKLSETSQGDAIFRIDERRSSSRTSGGAGITSWPKMPPFFGGSGDDNKKDKRRSGKSSKRKSKPKVPSSTPK